MPNCRPRLTNSRHLPRRSIVRKGQSPIILHVISLITGCPSRSYIVQSEHDEFIRLEHAGYLARIIPGSELILLPGDSHFAPLRRPELFNEVLRAFLDKIHF
jgi:pimeloyl-ACP methyl ester carboxylesterase